MKYEEIKIGDVFTYQDDEEKVISKSDEYKIITTIDSDKIPTAWREKRLHYLKPLKQQLPEEGLLTHDFSRSIIYRTGNESGYGFDYKSRYMNQDGLTFIEHPDHWRKATKREEEKFVKMLKKECKARGLFEDTKIETHADGTSLTFPDRMEYNPAFNSEIAWNKNGQIFHKGNFATPRKETTLTQVSKAVQEIGNFTIEQTESGVIILTPMKK